MEVGSNHWDLVLDIFNDRDASIILTTPLNNDVEDSWYCRREKLGNYSAKNAYQMIQESKTH